MKREPSTPGRLTKASFAGVVCFALIGCAMPVAEQISMLNTTAVCCTSMAEFKYMPLPLTEEKEVTFGAESPVFVFETGKSFFAAYRLPAWSAPYQIRAEAQGGDVRRGLFSPSALVLDGDFKVKRQFNVASMSGTNARPGVVHIFVNESNKDEHYLVLFTARLTSSEGVNTLIATPTTVAVGTVPLQIGATESRVSLRYSPMGVLQLKAWPYQPARTGQASKAQ